MLAIVFPGQGSQTVGMGRELAERFPEAKAALDEADAALDAPLARLCFEGPADELRRTENTQPAILAVSIAALRALEARVPLVPALAAGHSLGEYSAIGAAGGLGVEDLVRTVRRLGRTALRAGRRVARALTVLRAAVLRVAALRVTGRAGLRVTRSG